MRKSSLGTRKVTGAPERLSVEMEVVAVQSGVAQRTAGKRSFIPRAVGSTTNRNRRSQSEERKVSLGGNLKVDHLRPSYGTRINRWGSCNDLTTPTPQRMITSSVRQTMHASGSSRTPSARGSNFGLRSGKKDTRPISDKSFQVQCLQKVYQYLAEADFQITAKRLRDMSVKDFTEIFRFLQSVLGLNAKLVNLCEDVQRVLKGLAYPGNISRSTLLTVSTPHSWPHIIAMLAWLVDTIQSIAITEKNTEAFQVMDPDDTETVYNKVFFEHFVKSYDLFTQNRDQSEENERVEMVLEEVVNVNYNEIHILDEEIKRLEKEIQNAQLIDDSTQLRKLEEKRQIFYVDQQKLENHLGYLLQSVMYQRETQEARRKKIKELEYKLQLLSAQQQDAENSCRNQEVSAEEAQAIEQSCLDMQEDIKVLDCSITQLQQLVWQAELEMTRNRDKMSQFCTRLNMAAVGVKLTKANGESLQLERSRLREDPCGELGAIKTAVKKYVDDDRARLQKMEEKKYAFEQQMQKLNASIQKEKESIDTITRNINKLRERTSKKELNEKVKMKRDLVEKQEKELFSVVEENKINKEMQKLDEQEAEAALLKKRQELDIFRMEVEKRCLEQCKQIKDSVQSIETQIAEEVKSCAVLWNEHLRKCPFVEVVEDSEDAD